ncbi:hypothetical protein CB0940_11985 [Cercospora beticola]|uniref:Uncharacterized protein n=1 Tax=Cercospora beticola TaxID=122368 RepID=A0A2G5IFD2_CERBT|nr:hypothetical protein CB0940_11985 [Cercospora beticola]PIB03224.1 hypothetical protein CB0940_11985 [Cercospora beticola]WPB04366.1 hypothetical protein RHO25_009012 [Cercospora beticola]CAK1356809.1 unnamed protein product [Cercospora beticola]
MADSDDELEPTLVKVLPLALEETSKKRKGSREQDQHEQEHVEIANRRRLVPRTRKTLQKRQDEKGIEQQEISKSNDDQAEQHRKGAKASKEKKEAEAAVKEDENDKNQKVESQPDQHEKADVDGKPTHEEENHSDASDNDHDTNNQNRKIDRPEGDSQKSKTQTNEFEIEDSASGRGLLARAASTVTKLHIWWRGGKAVTEPTEPAKDTSDEVHKKANDEQDEQDTLQQNVEVPDEKSQQAKDLSPVPLPDTPPTSPVAYRPTPAACFPSYSVVHQSMPAAFFSSAQSSASDDDGEPPLMKVFQVGQQSKEDLEQGVNHTAQDSEKQGDEIENEGKQVKVNRKNRLQKGENNSMDSYSSLTPAPTTTTMMPPAPLALHAKRKHSPVHTPGTATVVTRADPIAFHFGAKPSPAPTSHGIEGPVLGTPFANHSNYTPSFGPVSTGKTQPPYSKAVAFAKGKGQTTKTTSSSEGKKKAEAEQEQEPESDPDDRSPLTEDQMWEEMEKALRRIEKKKR